MSEQLIQEQILYYRRRAPEYDVTAHGPLAAARTRIARLSSAWPANGPVLEAPKERQSSDPEVVERTLSDGTVHRVVKVFLDPPRLSARLGALGWGCELTTDGPDWVIGRAWPRE